MGRSGAGGRPPSSPGTAEDDESGFGPGPSGHSPMPTLIGDYHVVTRLGGGAMAELFLAHKMSRFGFIRRAVVKRVKRSRPDYKQLHEMLLDEARATACFDHPNLVSMFDVGETEQGVYLALEFVEGSDLRRVNAKLRSRKEALPFELAAFITVEVLRGLHHAHTSKDQDGRSLEIVHRDVNPSNVLIARSGHVKLADFGVVRMRERVQQKTEPGLVKGKYAYLAPEYIAGEPCSIQTDVYAAGIMLFELLSGRECFSGKTAYEVMWKIVNKGVPMYRLEREGVPEDLQRIVQRATAMAPERRYQSAQDMANALEAWLMRSGRHATPWVLSVFFHRHELLPGRADTSKVVPLAHLGEMLEQPPRDGARSTPPRSGSGAGQAIHPGAPRVVDSTLTPLPSELVDALEQGQIPGLAEGASGPGGGPHLGGGPHPGGGAHAGGAPSAAAYRASTPVPRGLGDDLGPRGTQPLRAAPDAAARLGPRGGAADGSTPHAPPRPSSAPPRSPSAPPPAASEPPRAPPVDAAPSRPPPRPPPAPPVEGGRFGIPGPAEGASRRTPWDPGSTPVRSESKTEPQMRTASAPPAPPKVEPAEEPAGPLRPEAPPRSGKLEQTPAADLLECLAAGGHTGVVEFRCGLIWKKVKMYQGRPIGVTSNMGMELIGEHLVKARIITRDELHRALQRSEREARPLTAMLIDDGALERAALEDELGKNLGARLNEVLEWRWGTFELKTETVKPAEFTPRLDLDSLIETARASRGEDSGGGLKEDSGEFDAQRKLEKAIDMARSIASSSGKGQIERPWRPED